MSRGMPSMTAFLGMLALAGYQNRDKLMEMFNNATSALPKSGSGGPAPAQSGLTNTFGGMLGGGGAGSLLGGGLNELFEQFTKNGQGDVAENLGSALDLTRRFRLRRSSKPLDRMF